MSKERSIPSLSLFDYSKHIKLNKPYPAVSKCISSEEEKIEIIDSLLHTLILEEGLYDRYHIPVDFKGKRNLLRSLLNIRPPSQIKKPFLKRIDRLLQHELFEKKIVSCNDISSIPDKLNSPDIKNGASLFLWKGDITCLKADAIVNAANKRMLGCFEPLHNCIDNVIHSAAGPLLREDCKVIMDIQNSIEKTGDAKITRAYNLPSRYILHTVGPIITGKEVSEIQMHQLASCYKSCLSLAAQVEGVKSIAFPCISTGVFNFPQGLAAEIAVKTVDEWLDSNSHNFTHIIFNVFLEEAFSCYVGVFR